MAEQRRTEPPLETFHRPQTPTPVPPAAPNCSPAGGGAGDMPVGPAPPAPAPSPSTAKAGADHAAGGPSSAGGHGHSIFGSRQAAEKVVGHVACPACGKEVAYRLCDVGARRPCPSCHGATLCIGESLLDGTHRPKSDGTAPQDLPAVEVRPRMNWQWSHLVPLGLAAGVVALAVLASSSSPSPVEGRVPAGSLALRAAQREGAVPEMAMPQLPEEISLRAIDELLGWDDALAALQQAESWQQVLRDYGIGDSDLRMVRLAEVIEKLRRRTERPLPPNSPYVEEFSKGLKVLREALKNKDIAAAKAALQRLEELFSEHHEEVAHFSRSLLTLKARLDQLVRIQEGPATILRLLDQAAGELDADRGTAAAELLAKAKFLALGLPTMSDADFAKIDAEVRRVALELRFVRGKLAVAAAKECVALKDAAAREAMVRLALDLLPDLPASRVRELTQQAQDLERTPIANPRPSPRGLALLYRTAYEAALQFYGRDKMLKELTAACIAARKRLEEMGWDNREGQKIAELLFSTLELEVGTVSDLPASAPDVAVRLSLAKEALEQATPWRGSPKWSMLRQAVAAKEEEIARASLVRAQELAKNGEYQRAVQVIAPALELGSPEFRRRMNDLSGQWKRLGGQQNDWQGVLSLVDEGKTLEAWTRFQAFEAANADFPKEKRDALKARLQPQAAGAVNRLLDLIDKQLAEKDWVGFRQSMEQLQSVKLKKTDRIARFQQEIVRLDADAEELWQQARANLRTATPDELATVYENLSQVVALNPNHPEAGPKYRDVKARALKQAEQLLRSARVKAYRGSEFRKMLQQVKRLDPDGKFGQEADDLLRQESGG